MEPLFIVWWMAGLPQYKNYGFLTNFQEAPGGNLMQISLDVGGLKSAWVCEKEIVFHFCDEPILEQKLSEEWGRA